ncbi:hypothetical protein F7Q99_01195 [Streptomyces kaniharaensis]|uniref:Uncharacterized protein n=1 Tax=Streptomyces kaniharaensis TaxID=212423 RepID=A0A6N7KHI3_9ACTN|nr:hypothetical protein [Streptomyces kaniharaensis]MQS10930.1 hypothetical protein [Streptomyces kaniharaensis]
MQLRFIGKDDKSGDHGSPTIFVDEQTSDLIIQGWKIDSETEAQVLAAGPIPDHETVIRIPARMAKVLKEALNVSELG